MTVQDRQSLATKVSGCCQPAHTSEISKGAEGTERLLQRVTVRVSCFQYSPSTNRVMARSSRANCAKPASSSEERPADGARGHACFDGIGSSHSYSSRAPDANDLELLPSTLTSMQCSPRAAAYTRSLAFVALRCAESQRIRVNSSPQLALRNVLPWAAFEGGQYPHLCVCCILEGAVRGRGN